MSTTTLTEKETRELLKGIELTQEEINEALAQDPRPLEQPTEEEINGMLTDWNDPCDADIDTADAVEMHVTVIEIDPELAKLGSKVFAYDICEGRPHNCIGCGDHSCMQRVHDEL